MTAVLNPVSSQTSASEIQILLIQITDVDCTVHDLHQTHAGLQGSERVYLLGQKEAHCKVLACPTSLSTSHAGV